MKKPGGKIQLWSLVAWLVIWQLVSLFIGQQIILPSPLDVLGRLAALAATGAFWHSIATSFLRIMGGFLLSLTIGSLLAGFAAKHTRLREFLAPIMAMIKATPVTSFIILMLVWVSTANLSILAAFLMGMPIVYDNLSEGIRQTDPQLLEMAQVFRLPRAKVLRYIYLSQVLPFFRAACNMALSLCWKAGVAAEVIGLPAGSIGEKLYNAKIYLQIPDVFAWTLVIILVSFAFDKLFQFLLAQVMKRLERI